VLGPGGGCGVWPVWGEGGWGGVRPAAAPFFLPTARLRWLLCVGFWRVEVVFEDCNLKGGVRQTLLPYAIIALCVYTITYPCTVFYLLYKNRMLIMEDQLLRAEDKCVGMQGVVRACPAEAIVCQQCAMCIADK
jgi:hypothetical protein